MTIADFHGLKTFELFDGIVQEIDWKPISIFISHGPEGTERNATYTFDKKEGARYLKALNLKNAIRKFNIL